MNKKVLILLGVILLIAVFGFFAWSNDLVDSFFDSEKTVGGLSSNWDGCLGDNQKASFELKKNKDGTSMAKVFVNDPNSVETKSFQIPDLISATHYHPIETHKCGVYSIKQFNFDWNIAKPLPDFKVELWTYSYDGFGKNILKLRPLDPSSFSNDFRIDSNEKYLVLLRGYLGKEDYALIIKDLKTLEDAFIFPITELEKSNPDVVNDIGLDGWSSDGRYFWAHTHVGAPRLAFIRIDIKSQNVNVFPVSEDVLGGDALNYDRGLVTVHPGNVWFGIEEVEQEEKAARRAKGEGTELYVQNLLTNEKHFVISTPEPLHYFQPRWISADELEYITPSGDKRTFTLPE